MMNFISKLSSKEKKIFYLTLAFVLLAFCDRLFLGPFWDRLSRLNEEIDQQKSSIKRDLRFLKYKDNIVKASDTFKNYYVQDKKEDDVINNEFFQTLEKLSAKTQVSVIKSNPGEVRKKKEYIEYFALLDVTGSFENVISFIHSVNSVDELLKVTSVNLTPKRGGNEGEISASLTVQKMIIHPTMLNEIPS